MLILIYFKLPHAPVRDKLILKPQILDLGLSDSRALSNLKMTLLKARALFRSMWSSGCEQTEGSSSLKGANFTGNYLERTVAVCPGRTAKVD
jgi:hypothetical protein